MSSKTFNIVSILILSGIILGTALTHPSKAMYIDDNSARNRRIAKQKILDQEEQTRIQSYLNQGFDEHQITRMMNVPRWKVILAKKDMSSAQEAPTRTKNQIRQAQVRQAQARQEQVQQARRQQEQNPHDPTIPPSQYESADSNDTISNQE